MTLTRTGRELDRLTPATVAELLFDDAEPDTLAEYLIGGVTKADLSPLTRPSLTWQALDADDFVLAPLPNTLFPRDNAVWIGTGLTVNPMAKPARRRESVNTRTVYRYHPLFRDADFPIWYGDDDAGPAPATVEGGDIHVIAPGVVLVGMGERTTSMGIEALAGRLFATGQARLVLVVELPRTRAVTHLDTLLTMVDFATPGDGGVRVAESRGVSAALAQALDADQVRLLTAAADRGSAQREQWNAADNYLAIAPGVVMGDERNVGTNAMLRRNGIDVITLAGSELGRARGGARCLSCPVRRHPLWTTGDLS